MIQSRNLRRLAKSAIAPLLGLVLIAYFVYHALQGDRGFLSWARLANQLEQMEDELASLSAERQSLEEKVSGLRPSSINPDLLDYQVRQQLGYTHPDEVVILTTPPSPVSKP